MICQTETCTNEATHIDQFGHPICQECVDGAIKNTEPASNFELAHFTQGADISRGQQIFEPITATEAAEIIKDLGLDHIAIAAKCTYDYNKNCSCPESLRPGICPTQPECGYTFRARVDESRARVEITIFEESLTARGLEKIAIKALNMPAIAKTTEDYTMVYEFSTALKRASVAARKKIKELKLNLKKQYNEAKGKIEKDQTYVLAIIDPIIGKLMKSRDYLESWTEAIKINNALKVAALAEAERKRINAEKKKQQDKRASELVTAAEQVEKDRLQPELDKRIFEREKNGMDFDTAWIDAGSHWPDGRPMSIEDIRRQPSELAEFAKDEPAEPVETQAFADISAAGLESLKNDDSIIENAVEANEQAGQDEQFDDITEKATAEDRIITFETENFSDDPASILYSTDPAEKEKQLLEQDAGAITRASLIAHACIKQLGHAQDAGFESQTATTATRRLIADIGAAAYNFSAAVAPAEHEPTAEPGPGDDIDCPF